MSTQALAIEFQKDFDKNNLVNNTVTSFPFWDAIRVRMFEQVNGKLQIHLGPYKSRSLDRKSFLKHYKKFAKSPFARFPLLGSACPFCRANLTIVDFHDLEDEDAFWERETLHKGALEHCQNCVYWRWHHSHVELLGRGGIHNLHEYRSCLSKVANFDSNVPEHCLAELCQWIRRNPHWWQMMSPNSLERLVADVFKYNYQHAEVIHVGRPDDGGVDVVLINCNHERWLIQVKRRKSSLATEGVESVRNLLGAMVLEKSCFGIVISTADHFINRSIKYLTHGRSCGRIPAWNSRIFAP